MHLMLLVNSPIAFNVVGESHNEGTFQGSFVCLMNTSFNHENGWMPQRTVGLRRVTRFGRAGRLWRAVASVLNS